MGLACAAAVLWLLTVFVCSSATDEAIYGFLHQSVSLPVIKPNGTTEIVCKFDGHKVFEWELDRIFYFGLFSGRTELKERSVLIKKLQKNDTGFYLLQFTLKNGNIEEANIFLNVLVPLPMPTINCTGNASIVYLSCNLNDHGSHVTTEWKHQNTTVIQGGNIYLSNENKHLTILNPEEFPGEYTCIVEQPQNSEPSIPYLVQNCFDTKGSSRTHIAILVSFLLVGIAVVASVLIAFCQKQTKFGIKNDGKGKLESVNIAENPEERDSQNSPTSSNVKNEDQVTHEASLETEASVQHNIAALNEPEKFGEDSADVDGLQDKEQTPFFVPNGE